MRVWTAFLVSLLIGDGGIAQARERIDDARVIAFVNVAVVSMQDEKLLDGQTVLIEGDRIRSIGPMDAVAVPPDATVIDGFGRYLMPGLADMHVHVRTPFEDGPLFLNAGVTTVLCLGASGGSWTEVLEERERSRAPEFMGPALYTAGPLIEGGETPDEAENIVRANAEGGFDVVKLHGDVSTETFGRLQETARSLGLKVTGHAQRLRGMEPVYAHRQDLAHVAEYLYASFNPRTPGLWNAIYGGGLALILLSIISVAWGILALWRRLRRAAGPSPGLAPSQVWGGIFTAMAWLLFVGLFLTVTDPLAGLMAGNTVAIGVVGALMLLVVFVAVALTMRVRGVWRERAGTTWSRAPLVVVVALAWTFVVCTGFLTPRSWRATEAAMEQIARDTVDAGIWVTPNLVSLDYLKRQTTDEFYELIERPELRYLRRSTRRLWIDHNQFRYMPEPMLPVQFALWESRTGLLARLTQLLHEAGVPLLAGSDATSPHGVLPGHALHEELSLLVQAGLTPYEALKTATVNPAIYLEAEAEVGVVAAGFRADLVLLSGNPLADIGNTRSRVGVMKRGRWFPASELEIALAELAAVRK